MWILKVRAKTIVCIVFTRQSRTEPVRTHPATHPLTHSLTHSLIIMSSLIEYTYSLYTCISNGLKVHFVIAKLKFSQRQTDKEWTNWQNVHAPKAIHMTNQTSLWWEPSQGLHFFHGYSSEKCRSRTQPTRHIIRSCQDEQLLEVWWKYNTYM